MKRFLLALLVFASIRVLIAQTETPKEKPSFQPAETLSVTDIPVPMLSVAIGTLMLDVVITETGKTQKVEIRRDIVSLTDVAVQAVQDWKFSPAMLEGAPIASRIPVAVTFRPPSPYSDPVPLPALIPQSDAAAQAEYQPAEVIHAEFPKYTVTSIAPGAVVLEVSLNEKGEAGEAKVLLDFPPFTEEAKAVVGQWRFIAATLNGKPVPSKIVLAFVPRRPVQSP